MYIPSNRDFANWLTVTVLANNLLSAAVEDSGAISVTQYRILLRLNVSGECKQLNYFSTSLGIHPSTVTTAIRKLESMGYCTLKLDPNDERKMLACQTQKAIHLLEEMSTHIVKVVHDFWSPYSNDELKLTFQDSLSTAIHRNAVNKSSIVSGSVEVGFAESVFVNYIIDTDYAHSLNLTLTEFRTLLFLSDYPRGIKPTIIAQNLLCKTMDVSVALAGLVNKEYAYKVKLTTDRRITNVFLTEKGTEFVNGEAVAGLQKELHELVLKNNLTETYRYFEIAQKVIDNQ